MLTTMNRQLFDSLEPTALARACMVPVIQRIHRQSDAVKAQVYAELTAGQRALMMFLVLHDHLGNDVATFYVWVANLLEEPKTWAAVKNGLRVVGDERMLGILNELEAAYVARDAQRGGERRQARAEDLDEDEPFHEAIDRLHTQFRETAPATFERMGAYVRNHQGEFVQFEE